MVIRQKSVTVKEMVDTKRGIIQFNGVYYNISELIEADKKTIITNALSNCALERIKLYDFNSIQFESIDMYLDSQDNFIGCNICYTINYISWGARYARGESHFLHGFLKKDSINDSEELYDVIKLYPELYNGNICW